MKSMSLERGCSKQALLAKEGSRRPLHRLSSERVRWSVFWGVCGEERRPPSKSQLVRSSQFSSSPKS